MKVQLFDRSNVHQLQWPESGEAEYTKKFILPLMEKGVDYFVDNIKTELYLLQVDQFVFPVTLNNEEYDNCYVCSPYTYYISCAYEYLPIIGNKTVRKALEFLLGGLKRRLLKGKINKVLQVNNWIFSTNLYPKNWQDSIKAIKEFLIQKFPDHTIIFRSVNSYKDKEAAEILKKEDFSLIPCRQIYFTDTSNNANFETRIFKSDLRLLNKSPYKICPEKVSAKYAPRIHQLYSSIYLEKHSMLHPQLNQRFVELAIENQLLHFKLLKNNDNVHGVIGYWHVDNVLTSPLLGYDIGLPKETGLYRMLTAVLALEAKEKQMIFHQSSGAAAYKKIRRAEPTLEYMAVCYKHLPFKRKLPWYLLQGIMNKIGIHVMKKYEM